MSRPCAKTRSAVPAAASFQKCRPVRSSGRAVHLANAGITSARASVFPSSAATRCPISNRVMPPTPARAASAVSSHSAPCAPATSKSAAPTWGATCDFGASTGRTKGSINKSATAFPATNPAAAHMTLWDAPSPARKTPRTMARGASRAKAGQPKRPLRFNAAPTKTPTKARGREPDKTTITRRAMAAVSPCISGAMATTIGPDSAANAKAISRPAAATQKPKRSKAALPARIATIGRNTSVRT